MTRQNDEAEVGAVPARQPADANTVMTMVVAYGAECRENSGRTERAMDLLAGIREAITGKEA